MLTNLFIRFGWSRDDFKWLLLQLVAVAGLITSNAFDVPYWCAYLGIPLSPTALHWVFAIAAVVLWLAGKYNSSPLPSESAMKSGVIAGSPASKLPIVLLACVLAGSAAFTMPACGKARHISTVADATALSATEAADDVEMAAFHAGSVTPAQHKAFSLELSKVYQAEIDIASLIKATPAGGTINLSQGLILLGNLRNAVTSALAALPASVRDPIAAQLNKASAFAGQLLGQ